MNLKTFSKAQLDSRIKTLAQAERELLHDVILTIREIDSRKMYLDFGYPSLYEYLVDEVKYLGGSAQRRIDAARLTKDVPEAAEKIRTGELTLGQITLVQKTMRKMTRANKTPISSEEKLSLLNSISNLSERQSEQKVAAFFDLPIIQQMKKTVQADGSVRYELTLTAQENEQLEEAQGLISHSVPTQDVTEFLKYVCGKIIKQKTSVREKTETVNSGAEMSTATVAVKPLSTSVKKSVLRQQQCCQYKNPRTGKICRGKWFPQIDHQQSLWADGTHDRANLQVLCASHNQAKYRKEANIRSR